MADQAFTEKSTTGAAQGEGYLGRSADQGISAAQDLKNKAADAASSSVDAMREQASEFADAARNLGSQAGDKAKETIENQKDAGAEYVSSIAEAMRKAAQHFDTDLPIAGIYMRKAASQVEAASDSVKNGELKDLVRNAQNFARRQPTAFLGMAVLAGFGVVRFLKSSAEHDTGKVGGSQDERSRQYDERGYRDGFSR